MLSIAVVVIAVAAVIVVWSTQRGSGPRSRLLRAASASLLAAVVLRELSVVMGHLPVLDLLKRIAMFGAETSAILLVLTFRRHSITKRSANLIWIATGIIAIAQSILMPFVPTLADGTLPPYQDVTGNPVAIAYFGIGELALIVLALVGGIGSWQAVRKRSQPLVARLSLGLLVGAAVCIVAYAAVGFVALFGVSGIPDAALQRIALFGTIGLILASIITGGLHKIIAHSQERRAVDTATSIIEPLWRTAVEARPEVVLAEAGLHGRERLVRLTVETNDAIALICSDARDELSQLREVYGDKATATAGVLLSQVGDTVMSVVPPAKEHYDREFFVRLAQRLKDDMLTTSVRELYEVRLALSARDQWRNTAKA